MKKRYDVLKYHVLSVFVSAMLLISCAINEKNDDTSTATKIPVYNIITGALTNGSITADKATAESGAIINLTVTPRAGYRLKSGTLTYAITGGTPQAITGTSFTMSSGDVTIYAEFEAIVYTITLGAMTNGTITSDKTNCIVGTEVNLTVTPGTNYQIKPSKLLYTASDGSKVVISNTTFKFNMPPSDIIITSEFVYQYNIGDTGPAGGKIFYVASDYSRGWRYLEAANSDLASKVNFSSASACSISTDTALGSGKTNTNNLKADANVTIVQFFNAYNSGGYSDWYLPGKDELTEMKNHKDIIANFDVSLLIYGYKYASSSLHTDQYCWCYRWDGQISYYDLDFSVYYVRAIRQF
jgi:hypothetical protein